MATWAAVARKAAETTAKALEEGVKFSWAENEGNKITPATLKDFTPSSDITTSKSDPDKNTTTDIATMEDSTKTDIASAKASPTVSVAVSRVDSPILAPAPASDAAASASGATPTVAAPKTRLEEFKLALGDLGPQLGLLVRLKGVAPDRVDECVNNIIEASLDDIIAVRKTNEEKEAKEAKKAKKAKGPDDGAAAAAVNTAEKPSAAPATEVKEDIKGKGKGEAIEAVKTDPTSGTLGGCKFSVAPDLPDGKPHPSGLTLEERRAQVQMAVQASLDLRRPTQLLASMDTADVVFHFTKPDEITGETELLVHRELLLKESTWFSREGGMAPPNEDGSPIAICLGDGPHGIVGQIVNFLYRHKIDECERNFGSPTHLVHIQCNVNQYILSVAYGMTRQQKYHLDKVQWHIDWLKDRICRDGPLGNTMLMSSMEIEWCEPPLRRANSCLWKEVIPEYRPGLRKMHILIARLNLIMLPWMYRQLFVRPHVDIFWISQDYGKFPWRAWIWRLRSLGVIQESDCDDWTVIGQRMSKAEVDKALKPYYVD
ncbi:hypothetical protein ACHAQA_002353 [Verticillium albo-atrum]